MARRLPFPQQLKYERELRSWSQADLASKLGTDPKTVNRWESGKRVPRPYLRRMLCELFGKSVEEFGLLARRSEQDEEIHPALDNIPVPLSSEGHIFREDYANTIAISPLIQEEEKSTLPARKEHWGEAPHLEGFHGRDQELCTLKQWVVDFQIRVVAISGMGGMGKTTLAAYFAEQIKQSFEYIFWQSLQNAPSLEHVLKRCIQFLSDQQSIDLPERLDDQLSLLVQYLRNHRCLLVLDNMESLLQSGKRAGVYRVGFESYGMLLQRVGKTQHMSCMLLTSREKPREIAHFEGKTQPVRSLHLSGIGLNEAQAILKERGIFGSTEQWKDLIERYAGNPLALKLVSEYIEELFEGNLAFFLNEETFAFGSINDLLDQHFDRLSREELEILFWLAIEREATSLERISQNLIRSISKAKLLEALESLRHRSLIETNGPAQFFLQPVVIEYVTERLTRQAYQEFVGTELDTWTNYAFMKAEATNYVRESQERLIIHTIADQLVSTFGKQSVAQKLRDMLSTHRQIPSHQHGYLAGNVLNLLIHLESDLRGADFSGLIIRQAYLQGAFVPEINFAHAHFTSSVFTNTFANILAVAFSPSGRLLATGTAKGDIWIYQAMSGTPMHICSGHTDGVFSIVFSSDEQIVVSSSDDQTIRIWNVSTGDCLRVLYGHTNRVRSVSLSPDDTMLVSGSDDETIRIWEMGTGRCLRTLHEQTSQEQPIDFRIWAVAFSFDGKLLVSGSTDGTICLWETRTWQCLKKLYGHVGGVRSVALRHDGLIIASGGNDQTIRLWNANTGDCFQILQGHRNRIWSVTFSPDGQLLASGSEDQTVRLWDAYNHLCVKVLQGHTHGVRSVSFNSDARTLASGGDDQTVRIWNIESGYCLQTLQGYTHRVWAIAFSSDGSMLVSGSEDQAIRLWDTNTGYLLHTIQARSHGVRCVAFSSDRRTLASGGEDQTIHLWDVRSSLRLKTLKGHMNWIWSVAFSPDGKMLASGSEDQTIRLWDVYTGQNLHTLQGHASWIRSVSFSPDGQTLASGSDDQTIKLWEAHTGHCIYTLKGHTNRIRSVTFSPDGQLLASGGEDRTVRFWEIETGNCLDTLLEHTNWVRSLAFSPDGQLLASGGEDQTIWLWEVSTGRCISILRGHTDRIRSINFNPTGNVVASGSDDGTIIFWNILNSEPFKILRNERPYERMNIFQVEGLTEAQKASLQTLGAIELPDE
jgi:WD40 repeat protein/transcriptional regulator with XRE-family HTH domain